ncbi:MAG: hypothetical protein RRA94_01790 [Bacteroidota bacterium]|nr:hypothetical protein [Bacteroidota bacterium]
MHAEHDRLDHRFEHRLFGPPPLDDEIRFRPAAVIFLCDEKIRGRHQDQFDRRFQVIPQKLVIGCVRPARCFLRKKKQLTLVGLFRTFFTQLNRTIL